MIASCLRVRDFHLEPHQAATGICDIDQLVQNFIDAEVGSAWFFRRVQLGQVNTSKHLLLVILNGGNGWYMLHGWYIGCFCRKDSE